ncbi:hypothetical protein LSTR_LSTR011711 [Laodelphax striatellus]|uniref:Uncharacterized protein n=1 Tax=Laodelphax striatellus TaxID=195883 RepID=A0A482WRF4_LAOST|nr:hypothetical protein LSTR_LSTR011711 [Laodelphax striatellus]
MVSCCGCTLETGAKIIGYVHLILSLMGLLMIGVILGTILTDDSLAKSDKQASLPTAIPPDERLFISHELSVAFAIFLPLAPAVVGVLSLFLLIGAKKKNSYLLLPWLIGVGLLIITYILFLLLFIFYYLYRGRLNNHFVSITIKTCVFTYCFVIVYSYFKELREERTEPIASIIASYITIVSLNEMQKVHHAHILDIALEMIVITVRVVQVIFSLILIVATYKGRSKYVCPWLVLSLLMVIVESIYLLMMGLELITGTLNKQIFSLSTHISITIYFILVVFSHYREMRLIESGAMDATVNFDSNKTKEPDP